MATELPEVRTLTVAVVGGTGDQGRGLAFRFAAAGLKTIIGSREASRAAEAAAHLAQLAPKGVVSGLSNHEAAEQADVVIIAVPWEGHSSIVGDLRPQLANKIVVDCVNPIGFDERGPYAIAVDEGSAAEQTRSLLPQSRVVAAFHHVSAALLGDPQISTVDCDVLVLGDDREVTTMVQQLAELIPGVRGIYAGRLRNAHQVEALSANLIAINRRYRAHAGVRITDI